ncbi:hypothetical protein [Sorangium sp. So ce385]|uniref:hypothetical protein n=1 Tax=Sorangium sp. So ce385 TaxID=3133308 RepID=UPI003F5B9384
MPDVTIAGSLGAAAAPDSDTLVSNLSRALDLADWPPGRPASLRWPASLRDDAQRTLEPRPPRRGRRTVDIVDFVLARARRA